MKTWKLILILILTFAGCVGTVLFLYNSMNRYEYQRDSLFCYQQASNIGIDFDQCMKARNGL